MHLDQLFRVMDQGHEEVHRFCVSVECEDVPGLQLYWARSDVLKHL